MIIKPSQIDNLKKAGNYLKRVLDAVEEGIKVGINTNVLETIAREKIKEFGTTPAFLGYSPEGAGYPYPAALCVSINEEIVHGIPNKNPRTIQNGDIVSIDCGLSYKGLIVDSARSVIAGVGDEKAKKLVNASARALEYAFCAAKAGNTTGDIGNVVETYIYEQGFTTPPELGGHGVGDRVHEEPFVPNIGDAGEGDVLIEGQVLALEPIVIEGPDPRIKLAEDGYTYTTIDNSRASHTEHTIIIQKEKPIIVTA